MIHNEYGALSGEEAVVDRMCRMLQECGHEVIRFSRSSAEIAGMRLGKARAFFSGIYSRSSAGRMRRLLREWRPDLVHVHNVFPLISPSVLGECRRAGVPVVMTVHNYRLACPGGLHLTDGEVCEKCAGGREYWCVLRNCQGSIAKSLGYALRSFVARKRRMFLDNVTVYAALTDFQRQRLIAEGFPADRIVVVPNMAGAGSGSEINGSPLGEYVGYVGRVSPEKGVALLVEGARRCSEIPFRVAGNCDRMPHLAREAPENFRFLGHLELGELERFYESSRLIVLCSTCFEGFPGAIAEAMLYGKPVICSRIGGLPEIVEDGVTGLLFEPGNVDELTEKIRYLWDRPEDCRRMGEAGRQKALREYSPDRYYERLMAVYEKAIALGPGGPRYAKGKRPLPATRPEVSRSPFAQRRDVLGVTFDLVDCETVLETIEGWRRAGRRECVTITNPHSVLLCRRDEEMRRATAKAGLTLPDGVGIVLAAKLLRYPHRGRVTGPALMLKLCDWGRRHGYRHYFFGGSEGIADRLAERLSELYPGLEVAGTYCPPFRPVSEAEDAEIVNRINAARPDVLWVGLGAPKQEKWMAAHLGRIDAPAMIGVGAAFDFHSGSVKWAPAWVRKAGMEWAYRLAQEPRRLWRRNLDSPLFLFGVLRQRMARAFGNQRPAQR